MGFIGRNVPANMEHKRKCYINICGSYGNMNSNNLTFLMCFEDICGYHGNKVTMATHVGLSSDRTL